MEGKRITLFNLLLLLLLFHCFFDLHGQNDFGAHPTGQNWHKINSNAVTVIFPEGMEHQAQRIAGIVNYIDSNCTGSVGNKKRHLNLVLRNRTTIPNGFVGLAPFRSHFFCTPPQETFLLGSSNWLDLLAIHEYRHAMQYTNSRVGVTKLASFFGGDAWQSTLNAILLPNWYFEGDAVITETALTKSGRGRSPFFTREQRALAFANVNYSYAKFRNGSFKDMVPDHYRLGYMMLMKARMLSGNEVTAKLLKEGASLKGVVYSFSKALKRNVGFNSSQLYELASNEKKAEWARQIENIVLIPTEAVNPKVKEVVTFYNYPRILEDETVIARKQTYNKTDYLVMLKNGEEKRITSMGITTDDFLAYGGGLVTWTELSQDGRRENKNYSDIILYDLKKRTKKHFTKRQRFFSPSPSPNGEKIAAITSTYEQNSKLRVLDSKTGKELLSIEAPENYFLMRTAWSETSEQLICVASKNNQLAIVAFDLKSKQLTELTPWTRHTIGSPVVKGDKVYFTASFSGIDNIYSTDLAGSKKIKQVSSVPIGAYEPDINTNSSALVFTEYTNKGTVISKQAIRSSEAKDISIIEPEFMPQFKDEETVAKAEGGSILDRNYPTRYPVKTYKGLLKGLTLHSWSLNPSLSTPKLDVKLDNFHNDLSLELSGGYNRNENNAPLFESKITIGRFYPVIELASSFNSRSSSYYNKGFDTLLKENFSELKYGVNLSLPHNWLQGNYSIGFSPILGLHQITTFNNKEDVRSIQMQGMSMTVYNLGFEQYILRRTAKQNVGTRLGLKTSLKYMKDLNGFNSDKIVMIANSYLPGFMANHNIKLGVSYQKELQINRYQFTDDFEYVRGEGSVLNDAFTKFSINYGLPLLYPDKGIWGITYFKRIRTNLFFDYGIAEQNKNTKTVKDYQSAGYELIFDNVHLNAVPLSVGFRNTFFTGPQNKSRNAKVEFMISTNF